MFERRAVQPREGDGLLQVVLSPGSMSTSAKVGRHGPFFEVQAWISKAAWLPSQHIVATRSASRWVFGLRSSCSSTPVSTQRFSQPGTVSGRSFCQKLGPPTPFGKRFRFSAGPRGAAGFAEAIGRSSG